MARLSASAMDARLAERVDARPLAATRMVLAVGCMLVLYCLIRDLFLFAAGAVTTPWLLPWPHRTEVVLLTLAVGSVICLLLLFGLFARASALALAGLFLWTRLADVQLGGGYQLLAAFYLLMLACGQPGGRWAVDVRIRGPRTTPRWVSVVLKTQLSAVYLFAATAKMNAEFLSGETLAGALNTALPVPLPWVAVATVLTELTLAVALWIRDLAIPVAAVGLSLHGSIAFLIGPWVDLFAFGIVTVAVYPLFLVDGDGLRRPGRHRSPAGADSHTPLSPEPT